MNNSWVMYSLMSADAYNVRNSSGSDVADLTSTISALFDYEQVPPDLDSGITGGYNQFGEPDSASFSHASGLQIKGIGVRVEF